MLPPLLLAIRRRKNSNRSHHALISRVLGQLWSTWVNWGQLGSFWVNLGRLWSTWINHYLKRRKFFKLFSGHLKRRNFFYLFSWGFTLWISPKSVSKILFVNEGYPNMKFLTTSLKVLIMFTRRFAIDPSVNDEYTSHFK